MYGMDEQVRRRFIPAADWDATTVRTTHGLDGILAGFEIDDHLFRPQGYSLNGIRDDQYWTLHVTPCCKPGECPRV